MAFQLHPQLEKDCITIGKLQLSRLLLMNDSQFPWFILVPEIEGAREIFQLKKQQQSALINESSRLAKTLHSLYQADKINIAAIGNVVPQLHVHHVVRYVSDMAWPAPIWGRFNAVPYTELKLAETVSLLIDNLEISP